MLPWNVIYALSQTTSRLDKEAILKGVPEDSDFWEGAKLALDPMVTFGVKKLPEQEVEGPGAQFHAFRNLTKQLADRTLTGNAAKDAILSFANTATAAQWEFWFSRILAKNLDCGAQISTINKFAPDKWKTAEFKCQLATDAKGVSVLPSDAFLEAKYDGVRCLWFITKRTVASDGVFGSELSYDVRAMSRGGKEFHNFNQIGVQLAQLAKDVDFPPRGIVIDGEVISENFNELMTQTQRKRDKDFNGYFMAFDILLLEDFVDRNPKTAPLLKRREALEGAIAGLHKTLRAANIEPLVMLSEVERGVNAEVEQERVHQFFQQQVEAGFEGIIIKDVNAPYQFDRTKHWIKMKPTDTWDLEVVDLQEGTGRLVGKLGALICRGLNSKQQMIEVSVGSGLSDEQRDAFWKDKASVIGSTAEILADCESKNQSGGLSLRFPRFVRFRDVGGEKS